jgi:peptidoglycan/LPS O-acetylase OafA/YrhL
MGPIHAATQRLQFIQAFRGVAASAVVLWHGSRFVAPYGTGVSGWFQPGATMGVSLFFLISGFIMVHTTRGSDRAGRASRTFAVKRVTRIWPVWLVALAGCIVVLPQYHLRWLDDRALLQWLIGSVALVPTKGQGPGFPPGFDYPVLNVGWTLEYEAYFYAIFAISLLFGRWRWWAFAAWVLAVLLLPLATGVALPLPLRLSPSSDLGFTTRYLQLATNPIVLLFAMGAGIAILHEKLNVRIAGTWPARLALPAVLACVAWQWVAHFRLGHGVLEWGLSLIPLMILFSIADKAKRIAVPQFLVWLGNISFSLYLCHPLVQGGYDRATALPALLRSGVGAFIVTTGLSLAVAVVCHRVLERGACTWLQRKLLGRDSARAADANASGMMARIA